MSNKELTQVNQDVSTQFMDRDYLENALRVANEFYKAGCFGAGIQNAHQAFVVIQAGAEMGMKPMEAMNSFYIVNGKITIYGPAQIKKLKQAGWKVTFPVSTKEKVTCRVEKGEEIYEESYTIYDLPSNSKAKGFAPLEKLRYHAVSRIIRFNLPEVLDAGNFYTPEEVEDFQEDKKEVKTKPPIIKFIQEEAKTIEALETVKPQIDQLPEEEKNEALDAYLEKEIELTGEGPDVVILEPEENGSIQEGEVVEKLPIINVEQE